MSRISTTLLACLVVASPAFGQGFSGARGIPGAMPSVPIPGTLPGSHPQAPANFGVPGLNTWWGANGVAYPGWFGGVAYPWYGGYGYGGFGYGAFAPSPATSSSFYSPTYTPPVGTNPAPVSGTVSATLTVQLPVAGTLWVDGVKQADSGDLYRVNTSAIAAGQTKKVKIRAEWLLDGKRMRAERTLDLKPGESQKVTLILGDPVDDK